MRGMLSELWGPPGLILLGTLLAGFGVYLAAVKQTARSNSQSDVLRDVAARTGNNKLLEELIQERSRALNADRGKADDIADALVKRLPSSTEQFNAMEENKRSVFENRTADFRLKWEPLFNATLSLFDKLVDKCTKAGINVEKTTGEPLTLTSDLPGPSPITLRGVIRNHVVVRIMYTPIVLSPGESGTGAQIEFHIQDRRGRDTVPLYITLNQEEGHCLWSLPGHPPAGSGNVRAPKDGKIPQEFLDFIYDGFARVFERFLLEAGANDSGTTTK